MDIPERERTLLSKGDFSLMWLVSDCRPYARGPGFDVNGVAGGKGWLAIADNPTQDVSYQTVPKKGLLITSK
jgi:hypothetical protein